jgi:TrmH family RNA methyltransferase
MQEIICSLRNEQVKNLVKLRERKHRERQSLFLIEGLREIQHAITAGFDIERLYFCPACFPSQAHQGFIAAQRDADGFPLVEMSDDAFAKASFREGPDGLIALARQHTSLLTEIKLSANPLVLVLEGIEKPGNLGSVLRSADGAGVDAVILVDCVLDLYNPNAIRSSQGLIFALPTVAVEREALSQWLAQHDLRLYATTPDATQLHWTADFSRPAAILMGSESEGLSDYWLAQADLRIRLPMAGQADSLNVGAATAVCLYEAMRQRARVSGG